MELKYDGKNEYLPLRDVVFHALRQAIVTGEFSPGERLMEIKLANKLGVSRIGRTCSDDSQKGCRSGKDYGKGLKGCTRGTHCH